MQCHCTETVGGRDSPKTQFVEAEAHNASPDQLAGMGEIPPHTPRHCPLWEGVTVDALCTSIPSHFFIHSGAYDRYRQLADTLPRIRSRISLSARAAARKKEVCYFRHQLTAAVVTSRAVAMIFVGG